MENSDPPYFCSSSTLEDVENELSLLRGSALQLRSTLHQFEKQHEHWVLYIGGNCARMHKRRLECLCYDCRSAMRAAYDTEIRLDNLDNVNVTIMVLITCYEKLQHWLCHRRRGPAYIQHSGYSRV